MPSGGGSPGFRPPVAPQSVQPFFGVSLKTPRYKVLLALVDWFTLNLTFILALKLRTDSHIDVFFGHAPWVAPEVLFFFFYGLVAIAIFRNHKLYKINVFLSAGEHAWRLMKAYVVLFAGIAILSFFTKSTIIVDSRLALLYFTGLSMTAFLFVRIILFRSVFRLLTNMRVYNRRVLMVGTGETGRDLVSRLERLNPYGLKLIGFADDELPEGFMVQNGLTVLGSTESIPDLVSLHRADEVLVCLDRGDHNALFRAIDIAMSTSACVKIASPLYRVIPERLFTDAYANIPVVDVTRYGQQLPHRLLKRVVDVLLSLVGMLLLSPLFLTLAALIKLEGPGPILHTQTRVGKDGRQFRFFKFRSMQVGSDRDPAREAALADFIRSGKGAEEGETKIVDSSRITRIGAVLRRTSLDELPQLINVLRGEMSLVGPRPCLPYEYDNYKPWHRKRLSVVPGCTGVWQVNGRSEVGFDDMVILDLYYIQNPSILTDLGIILRTIPVMLFGRGGG